MSRGRAPKFQLQRAQILDSAAILFAKKGFHNASMAELSQACGVSKALLYHYYKDKEEILFDIADSYVDGLNEIILETAKLGLSPEAHFEKLISSFMDEYEHSEAKHVVLVQDVKFLQDEMRSQVIGKQRLIVNEFAKLISGMYPALGSSNLIKPLAMSLFGMINWTFTWLKPSGGISFAQMAPLVSSLFIHGVEGISTEVELNNNIKKGIKNE